MSAYPTDAAAPEAIIRLDGVNKVFRRGREEMPALTPTSLEVRRGEFLSLLGPSGCGKSTLLRMIIGLETPTSGTITVNGSSPKLAQGSIGVMLQTPALMPWETVRGNVLLPAFLQGRAIKPLESRVDELLEMVGLSAFASAYPGTLSGGMRQRVALARALLFDPDILMLDEPFGALDHITREQLNAELARLCAHGNKTTLLVTHDINEAIYLSDRIVVMSSRPGRVAAVLEVDLPKSRDGLTQAHRHSDELALHIRELLGLGSITA
ncbi:ABC transporter ATP-binding protein [Pusillimonas caeni]|uniref:ABC transporter ATP-binding protein n=1 Tax=Pusillimonas caeni TaxID=1348472 RepID=UPI000E59DAA8|nr:ABC transporter ATP-binding protein [Pusillimonas caeni]TFL15578.1 ABC transporter ATP-binding protein [Pusillimonas caeni]